MSSVHLFEDTVKLSDQSIICTTAIRTVLETREIGLVKNNFTIYK